MDKSDIQYNKALHDYIRSVSLCEPDVLKRLRAQTDKDAHSIMQIPPEQGQFMAFLVAMLNARKAIEIGTYTGYSALRIASAMASDGILITCDINDTWASIGKKYWREAGVAERIDFRLGAALDTIEELFASGQEESFDFAFIDADKTNYIRYYESCLSLLRPGGIIAIDNVLLFGSVLDASVLDQALRQRISDEDIAVLRQLNQNILNDARVDLSMLAIADGLTLVRKL